MGDQTGIEWTDATWNPVVGCSILSPGCTHCYAMLMAARIERMTPGSHYAGTTKASKAGPVWTGRLALAPDHILTAPLRWRRPRRIFVNSMGDLFHEDVPDEWIDRVFAVMARSRQHTFQVLTKRAARMREYLGRFRPSPPGCGFITRDGVDWSQSLPGVPMYGPDRWPLPNVWLGVSTEDQARADERIPHLLATPAAVRFVSAEPLLGRIDFTDVPWPKERPRFPQTDDVSDSRSALRTIEGTRLDWIIVGGESGPRARPMRPDWARSIRDQCAAAGVPFFFKQWGEWAPGESCAAPPIRTEQTADWMGDRWTFGRMTPRQSEETHRDDEPDLYRVGKAHARRLLDGRTHDGMPVR